ncbi:MAG: HsdR family type I site-specific deoxyribonuclease [Chloroflexi bacterium]|nr:HsdR family type I site-specific deoxyribonuclease [Chloroflexota bacterium]
MFNEENSVERFVLDVLTGQEGVSRQRVVAERGPGYAVGAEWEYVPADRLGRREATDVLLEGHLQDALLRLNPDLASHPERTEEVIHRLRTYILGARDRGSSLVQLNESFAEWLRGEHTMPVGENDQHVTIRLLDFDHPSNNRCVVTRQLTVRAGRGAEGMQGPDRRFDLVLFVNGIPLVVGEAKSPVRPAISWVDAAAQVHDDYEENVRPFFVPNVFSFGTEGRTFRYGAIGMPIEQWAPWRTPEEVADETAVPERLDGQLSLGLGRDGSGLEDVRRVTRALLRPSVILDILRSFALYSTDRNHQKVKVICRPQQYYAVNQIVDRVVAGRVRKGLIWHFQGSGKSLLMLFAAQKLRIQAALRAPTVLIVVDRIDLDTQITATFNAASVPNVVPTNRRDELHELLQQQARKVIITTIHKFAEAPGLLDDRDNIIVLVDEAHRTQEGDLGQRMREALPNAFFFGLTGTPISRSDRNTFWAFGAEEDERGYLSRYSFDASIRDGATLPLHFQSRLAELHVDREAIDAAFKALTASLDDEDRASLSQRAGRMGNLLKTDERIRAVVKDVVEHFQAQVEPNGFKGQLVVYDRAACVRYKQELDRWLPPEASEVVMTVGQGEQAWRERFGRTPAEEAALLDRFRDPRDPLKLLVVTSKLLTGFDAPILQAMYLDRPLRDHNLLQAICRTNRPFPNKSHGLIVDYLGIFDDVAKALVFDGENVTRAIANLEALTSQVAPAVAACLDFFPGVDRTVGGYEGLIAAQECLPTNVERDAFALAYRHLAQLWEALSPHPVLPAYAADYQWLTSVYDSVRPTSGHGKLLWRALGAKTLELIHQNVHVEAVRDDLETIVLDPELIEDLERGSGGRAREVEIKISLRLQRHPNEPPFVELGRRLEELRDRHARGLLQSVEFLKQLLQLARDVVAAEREHEAASAPIEEHAGERGKAALTELFAAARNGDTPVMVQRIVDDIDTIVRAVSFPEWQRTVAGEREVQQHLRRTLLKYKLHRDQDLFDRAYGYIKQYY